MGGLIFRPFFLLLKGFAEQMVFYEFHWDIQDECDSETDDEWELKAEEDFGGADDYVQVLDTEV